MSNISDNKIILIIDGDDALAEQLTVNLDNHEIIHVKTEMEADLKYREIVEEDKQINLIVLYDVTGNDSNWEAVLETLFDISIQPNIIVLDAEPDIQKAVAAYSNMAYHYHDKKLTTHDDVNAWLAEIKANPLPQIKLDKSFYKDNVWSRHMKDRHEMMVEVKLGNQFDAKLNQILEDSKHKQPDELTLIERAIPLHRNNELTIETCKEIIELTLRTNIDSLSKPNLLIVEDEKEVRDSIVLNLKPHFNLFVAEDGEQALDIASSEPSIHLALMDIYLPDIKGTELYPQIREQNDLIVLTALTAYKDVELAEKLIRKGAFGFLNKPFEPIQVWQKLSKAWNKKVWPFFEGKMDIQALSLIQRIYFLNQLILERKHNAISVKNGSFDSNSYTRYQLDSILNSIFNYDVYGLFPELLVDPDLMD